MIKKKLLHSRSMMLLLAAVLACSITACSGNEKQQPDNKQEVTQSVKEEKELTFDEYLESLYVNDLASDFTKYSQFVQNPNNYGITDYSRYLSAPTQEAYDESTKQCEERLAALSNYDYNSLSASQKLDYDTIKEQLEARIAIKDCFYYAEPLSTTDGDHIVAPGIVSLYATRFFETLHENGAQDIASVEKYFEVYDAFGTYFKQIADFERKKAEQGMFMTIDRAKQVITTCSKVVNNDGADFVTAFEDYIVDLSWLSDEDKKTLIAKNSDLVKEQIVSGYQAIIDAMNDCMSKSSTEKGLANTENGKKYYESIVKSLTSSDITPLEMANLLEEKLKVWNAERDEIMNRRPKIMSEINNTMANYTDSAKLATMLTEKIKADFPEITLDWGVDSMPQSLNGFAAGLFYPPAFDSTVEKETVYAGTMLTPGTANYVQTIGHEGVPGHLYHYSYMKTLDISNYRRLLGWSSFTGYLEGWTTYIEEYAYRYAGLDEDQARLLELQRLIELAVLQRVDTGVNYEGWSMTEINGFLRETAPTYLIMSAYIKGVVEDSPCLYSSYVVGYVKLTEIKEAVKEKMGGFYTDKAFHEQYLNVGPAKYERIKTELGLDAE